MVATVFNWLSKHSAVLAMTITADILALGPIQMYFCEVAKQKIKFLYVSFYTCPEKFALRFEHSLSDVKLHKLGLYDT